VRETTSLGAAIAAGFAVGVWKDLDELKQINREGRMHFKPEISREQADKMYKRWNKAVEMSRGWSGDEDED
jgi:glycerol kinase